jgi:hypothetical protein
VVALEVVLEEVVVEVEVEVVVVDQAMVVALERVEV